MITHEELVQLKAYTHVDGAMLGGLWILSFACFVGMFYSPILGLASNAIGIGSLVLVGLRLRNFRDTALDGYISFRRAYAYCMMVFFYAALLMAAGQFVYFQFLDNGFLLEKFSEALSMPEFKAAWAVYGLTESDVSLFMENQSAMRPIDNALQYLTINIFLGLFISLPMAALMMRKPRNKQYKQ